MGPWQLLFGWRKRQGPTGHGIPTVKFDKSRVTPEVRTDLKRNISDLADIDERDRDFVYRTALVSIERGRDLGFLVKALTEAELPGVNRRRAIAIATHLNNRAGLLMQKSHQLAAGITRAKWLASNADEGDEEQTRRHMALSGKVYDVQRGMLVGGKRLWPGSEEGCKCVSIPIIDALETSRGGGR